MQKSITVFVHHEIYDIRAKAYWLDCLIQTKKYNRDVVLCGTKIQESMVANICDFVDADSIVDERWEEFKKYFKNYTTTYSDNYQLAIHKRLFMLSNYMATHNLNEVILIDSDVLSYTDWSTAFDYSNIDCACCINENQYFLKYGDKKGLRWVANAGVSYWKKEALDDLLGFVIDQYKNPSGISAKYEFHKKYNIPGGG